jgi:hypothetical protein
MRKIINLATIFVAIIASFSLSSFAMAKSPSFTYVEAEFVTSGSFEISDGNLSVDVDTDGFAVTGSLELGIFFVQASRFELDGDTLFDTELEDSISAIAAGLTFELPRSQAYGLVRVRRDEFSVSGPLVDEEDDLTFFGVEAGIRVNLTDRFEVNGNIGLPSADEGTSFGVGAQFFITNNLGITANFRRIEAEDSGIEAEFDTTSIGLRWSF